MPESHPIEEPDNWALIEKDALRDPYSYCVNRSLFNSEYEYSPTAPTIELFALDLVRRAKSLAGA